MGHNANPDAEGITEISPGLSEANASWPSDTRGSATTCKAVDDLFKATCGLNKPSTAHSKIKNQKSKIPIELSDPLATFT
jgi:hypothetical protein